MSLSFDPVHEAEKLRGQLTSGKRSLLFFLGAGASQAAGMDGVGQLAIRIRDELAEPQRQAFDRVLAQVGKDTNVEHVLSRIRLYRELLTDSSELVVDQFTADSARSLDRSICEAICRYTQQEPPKGLAIHSQFAAWLGSLQRGRPAEVFSTNYDLLLEGGFEIAAVPYFDGFIGGARPYFSEALTESDSHVPHWIKLWKLHGSVDWKRIKDPVTGRYKAIRAPAWVTDEGEFLIFPSRENYIDSHQSPFAAFHSRFRHQMAAGECSLIIVGYSFKNDLINEIVFGSLRANNQLAVTVLLFDAFDREGMQQRLVKPTEGLTNVTIYSPKKAIVGGIAGDWATPLTVPSGRHSWPFWDVERLQFTLGDFSNMPQFLREFASNQALAKTNASRNE